MGSRRLLDTAVSVARALHRAGEGRRILGSGWQAAAPTINLAVQSIGGRRQSLSGPFSKTRGVTSHPMARLHAARGREAGDGGGIDSPSHRPPSSSTSACSDRGSQPTSALLSASTLLLEQKRSIWLPTDACESLSYASAALFTGAYFAVSPGAAAHHVVACPALATAAVHLLLKLAVSYEDSTNSLSEDVVADRSMAPLYLCSGKAGALSLALSLAACLARAAWSVL